MDERHVAIRHRKEARGRERDRHDRKQRREQEGADDASEQKRDPTRALDHRAPPISAGFARRNNAAMSAPTIATSATLIAAPSPQSGLWNMRNQTSSAAMMLRPPPRIAGGTKKPRGKTKTMSAAPTTPEAVIGRNTRQKMRRREAPSPRAARSTRSSTDRMEEASGKTANGVRTC